MTTFHFDAHTFDAGVSMGVTLNRKNENIYYGKAHQFSLNSG